jgi:hypothetical protein
MSTHATLFLTKDNEHCYIEHNAPYYEECKTEQCIVLEVDPKHRVETDEEGTRIIIEEGTELYNHLINADYKHDAVINSPVATTITGNTSDVTIGDAIKKHIGAEL